MLPERSRVVCKIVNIAPISLKSMISAMPGGPTAKAVARSTRVIRLAMLRIERAGAFGYGAIAQQIGRIGCVAGGGWPDLVKRRTLGVNFGALISLKQGIALEFLLNEGSHF
jgi:hypothetical protein